MIGGKKTIWQSAVYDKNKIGTDIVNNFISCVEVQRDVLAFNPVVGVAARECRIILQSDTPRATKIKSDDLIIWGGHKYSVQTTTTKPNALGINSFDTYILLK